MTDKEINKILRLLAKSKCKGLRYQKLGDKRDGNIYYFNYENDKDASIDLLISRRYGFIEWLVAHREEYLKPYEAVYSPLDGRNIYIGEHCIPTINGTLYDSLLSALSLCDDHMKFLLSILK